MQNNNVEQESNTLQEATLRFIYFMGAIVAICAISIWGLGWCNVQVIRLLHDRHTSLPRIWEITAGVFGLIILVVWIMPSIYAYCSRLLCLIKRDFKYLLIPLGGLIWLLSNLGTNVILEVRSSNLPVVLPHANIENLKRSIQQLCLGESCLIVFLGLLFNSYHISSGLEDLSKNTLKNLWEKINHWKEGGITCQFEQLRIHDPIVQHYYEEGFSLIPTKGRLSRTKEQNKIEEDREYVGERLQKIGDLRSANFQSSHKNFLRGVDLSDCNLSNVNLSGMDLECTNLKGANLSYTDFTGAILQGANLAYTVVAGTKFQGANLTNICIERWSLGIDHIMPEFNHQTVCERIRFDENSTENFYPSKEEKFLEGEFEQLCQDTLNVVRIIIRNDKYVKVRIFALGCVLASNPNQQPRGAGNIGDDFYNDVPNENGNGVKVKQEFELFQRKLDQIIKFITIDIQNNFETIRFDLSSSSSDVKLQLKLCSEEIERKLTPLIDEVKKLSEQIEIRLKSGLGPVQNFYLGSSTMTQTQLGSNSGNNAGNTVNAGNNAAINIGNNNQAQVQANVNQPIPQELTLDDVCRQLEELISSNRDISEEDLKLAKEHIGEVRDLATNQKTEKKSLLKTIINSLKGALIDAGNLYTECKKFIDALPSFFQ
jgi:hypothetical protein